jgi:hypothetical protein
VVIAFAYKSISALPTKTFLHDRIVALQQLLPHLYAHVVDGRTNKPAWELRPTPYAPDEILRPDQTIPQLSGSGAESGQLELALKAALACTTSIADEKTPLWQVQRYVPANDTGTAYLAVWVSHQLADGVGALRLAQAILSPDISTLQTETSLAPKMEDSVNIKPPVTHLLPVVFQKLLLPSLPSFVQAYFKPTAPWPAERILQSPTQCEEDLLLVQIPGELVSAIKSAGASHGVRTLHPILELAYLASIWAVFSRDKAPLLLDGQTPRNERAAEKGHGQITGNYVSSLHHQVTPTRDSSFWSLAKDCARSLTAEVSLRRGRYAMGMLAYVPDPDNFSSPDPKRPTGWEDFFLNQIESEAPYDTSMTISNLGLAHLPSGAIDIAWAQPASPFIPPLLLDVVGHRSGVSVTVSWREGCVVTRAQVEQMNQTFTELLTRLSKAEGEPTLDELTA